MTAALSGVAELVLGDKTLSSALDEARAGTLPARDLTGPAALRPFANEADTWLDSLSDRYHPGVTEPRQQFSYAKAEFSLGDLRRARRLLSQSTA